MLHLILKSYTDEGFGRNVYKNVFFLSLHIYIYFIHISYIYIHIYISYISYFKHIYTGYKFNKYIALYGDKSFTYDQNR